MDENWNAAARKAYVFLDVCLIAILGDNLKKITGGAARSIISLFGTVEYDHIHLEKGLK